MIIVISRSILLFLLFLLIIPVGLKPVIADFYECQWIDLTHDFSEKTIYWPTADPFIKTTVFNGPTKAGYHYSAYNFSGAEHGGTHIDAPIHFSEKGYTVDQIPLEQLIGHAVVIQAKGKLQKDRNYQVSVNDILLWEKAQGVLEDNSIVLIDTGSGKFWPNKKAYMGTDKRGEEGVKKLRFPGLHPNAAKFLAEKRRIKAVGIDTPGIDFGGSKIFETHRVLSEANIPIFENIANLEKLPPKGFTVIALPMKIKGGSGGPLRIVASVSDQSTNRR